MNIRNTYWIVSLSFLLSLSLALPVCCHADMSELFSHHQETSAHAAHGQQSDSDTQSCDCGHEFVKDYQKTKKAGSQRAPLSSPVVPSKDNVIPVYPNTEFTYIAFQQGVLSDSGPSLHLLNSVFLN
jgi:hypothetical protein